LVSACVDLLPKTSVKIVASGRAVVVVSAVSSPNRTPTAKRKSGKTLGIAAKQAGERLWAWLTGIEEVRLKYHICRGALREKLAMIR
jgi:hypothetical protein